MYLGQLGSIKLFNTLQNECFRYLFGHQKQVRKLQFSKSKPRWLFSKCAFFIHFHLKWYYYQSKLISYIYLYIYILFISRLYMKGCSEDMTVRLWDIGPPNVNDQNNSSMYVCKINIYSCDIR